MRALYLAAASLAAVTVLATPAQSQSSTASAFVGVPSHGVTIHSGFGDFRGDRRDRRRDRDFGGDVFIGEWPQQGDTVWRADSYNDWWHDRPDRAYPRWLSTNSKCERLWWSGSGWRC